ncbi:MAG: hypothetical protein J7647_32735 [Cyanobacteria bacterium SBLK]|nr:hypothetical protein [Cyanobacteria bacterium SBLK]
MSEKERHEIVLLEAGSNNPPDLLDRIKSAVDELFDDGVSAAGGYVKGKGEQELAKAAEIKTKAFAHLANLELERERLLTERDKVSREDKQKMYELKTQRLDAVMGSLIKLKELGVEIQLEVIVNRLLSAMDE